MSGNNPTRASWKKTHKTISWGAAGHDALVKLVTVLTDNGCAVMFGRTMDGGALVLQIFAGTERSKEYVTAEGDIASLFEWAMSQYS